MKKTLLTMGSISCIAGIIPIITCEDKKGVTYEKNTFNFKGNHRLINTVKLWTPIQRY